MQLTSMEASTHFLKRMIQKKRTGLIEMTILWYHVTLEFGSLWLFFFTLHMSTFAALIGYNILQQHEGIQRKTA